MFAIAFFEYFEIYCEQIFLLGDRLLALSPKGEVYSETKQKNLDLSSRKSRPFIIKSRPVIMEISTFQSRPAIMKININFWSKWCSLTHSAQEYFEKFPIKNKQETQL